MVPPHSGRCRGNGAVITASLPAGAGNRITSRIESLPVKHHRQPVDAQAEPAGRRHAVRERLDVVRVALLGLDVPARALVRLHREPRRLLLGVVQLAEGVAELHPADVVLEALDDPSVVVGRARERRELDRVVVEDRRLRSAAGSTKWQCAWSIELRPRPVGRRVDAALVQPRAQLVLVARPEAVLVERVDEPDPPPRRFRSISWPRKVTVVVPSDSQRRRARRGSRCAPSCPGSRHMPRTTRAS